MVEQAKAGAAPKVAIGAFGSAAASPPMQGPMASLPLYFMYEASQAALNPARALAEAARQFYTDPLNPLSATPLGRSAGAAAEMFERATRRYGKPAFGIESTMSGGRRVGIVETEVWSSPFCRLIHFEKTHAAGRARQPRVLLVAPMSGHFATLLRGTVEAFLPEHDVFVTDWADARTVPLSEGSFDLDDYIDYVIAMMHALDGDVHVVAVCQPAVPVLAAVARMEEGGDPHVPRSMTLMGGPIDTRRNPTEVNLLAERRGTDWFRRHVITLVPFPHLGAGRAVYPGFLQLTGFVSMNLDRHINAHRNFFSNLVRGDGSPAEKHREFYDEYLAVMDLTAEFYLQTVDQVFVRHALPEGRLAHRGRPVRPDTIRRVALMTVEGENDDISGVGQTEAAHDLCSGIPGNRKTHYLQPTVGHYGVFNGSRFRAEILPRIHDFIVSVESDTARAPKLKLAKG